jgi:hypothetical protein
VKLLEMGKAAEAAAAETRLRKHRNAGGAVISYYFHI